MGLSKDQLKDGWNYATYRVGLMFQIMDEERANRDDTGRNPDGTFKPGVSGNPSGRPKGTMKDYLRRKFMEMTEEEKELFLKNVSPEMQIRLAEGNPHNTSDVDSNTTLNFKPYDELPKNNSVPEDKEPHQTS